MEQVENLQKLSDRIPKRKADIFNVTTTSVIYDGSTLTHFLSEQGSRKSLRHALLLSKIEDAFDLQYGDELNV